MWCSKPTVHVAGIHWSHQDWIDSFTQTKRQVLILLFFTVLQHYTHLASVTIHIHLTFSILSSLRHDACSWLLLLYTNIFLYCKKWSSKAQESKTRKKILLSGCPWNTFTYITFDINVSLRISLCRELSLKSFTVTCCPRTSSDYGRGRGYCILTRRRHCMLIVG